MRKGASRGPPAPQLGFSFAANPELNSGHVGDAEVRCAYRMDQPSHLGGVNNCRRNCRGNPSCLVGLGERAWLDAEEEEDSDGEEADELVRLEGVPAGLRNLGNTCYVNSFLQIWFHNLRFRQATYAWEPSEDPIEKDNETILEVPYEPKSQVASLQALFAMMQHTRRKFIDPADFICKLGLNPSVQQDAQEFSKLFISLLEDSLLHQSNIMVKTMIQNQFRGEYAYVTKCSNCERESVRPTHFYELDLALMTGSSSNKTVADCLKDFTKIEHMTKIGTNDERYFCESCQSKQDATRRCRLTQLPPVLNLQLNRFQYDMTLGRKKKLNSNIQFPEELDMSEYLEPSQKPSIYSLTGVLMHVGPDANHGHYIAHIQELDSGAWFKFSDETVVPLTAKSKLGLQEEDGMKKVGKVKSKAGVQNSNNAYMLVYMLQDTLKEVRMAEAEEKRKRESVMKASRISEAFGEPEEKRRKVTVEYVLSNGRVYPASFPVHLRNKIDRDNSEFMEESRERLRSRKADRVALRAKRRRMVEQYKGLKWQGIQGEVGDHLIRYQKPYEFLPTQFLMSWLTDPMTCGPIETKGLLCIHGNLDIDKLPEVKVCSADMVTALYKQYGCGEGPRLNHNKLCWTCVMNKARLISLDFKMSRDQEFLSKCESPCDGTGFWVGKRSFQQWKRHAKVALEDLIIQEINQRSSPTPNKLASRQKVEKPVDEVEPFCLTELQAKLQKMGTNVSLAPQDGSSKGNSSLTGLSVIKNGEAFKMQSVAEMKMNLSDDEKKGWKQESWNKPVQAVKPMQKAPKPSATVKPFIKSEGMTSSEVNNIAKEEDTDAEVSREEIRQRSLSIEGRSKSSETLSPLSDGQGLFAPKSPSRLLDDGSKPIVKCNGDSLDLKGADPATQALPQIVKETSPTTLTQKEAANGISKAENNGQGATSSKKEESGSSEVTKTTSSPASSATSTPSKPTAKVAPDAMLTVHHEDPFNADIQCHHGNMRIEQGVSSYFKKPITFQFGSPVCALCEEEVILANKKKERLKEEAMMQKARLSDLFGDRERPKWSKKTTIKVFLLSSNFVSAWRAFIKGRLAGKAGYEEPITDVNNATLLCEHEGLLHPPNIAWEVEPNPSVVMITEEEFAIVKSIFHVDVEIQVDRVGMVLTSTPATCDICSEARRQEAEQDRLRYKDQVVHVRRISPDEKLPEHDLQADPEYCSSPVMGEAPPPSRRSHRRPKVRGEREFVVHSDMKLKDFKVKLMEAFKVATYDQNLMVNGVYLTENEASLGQLKVLPGSLIFLRADEPTHIGPAYHAEEATTRHEEQGFKGTGLLSN